MKKKVLFIVNPISGQFKENVIQRISEILDEHNIDYSFKMTAEKGDAEKISENISAKDYSIIAPCGGDGTINEVINGLYKNKDFEHFSLCVFPIGTANVLAQELEIDSIKQAIHILLIGKEISIYTGIIKSENDLKRFLMMAGIGFDAYIINNVNLKLKQYLGKWAYVIQAIKTAFKTKKLPLIKLKIKGKQYECFTVIMCCGKFYAGKFEIAPGANLEAPSFEIIMIKQSGLFNLLKHALLLSLGQLNQSKNVETVVANKIDINYPTDYPVQADGDVVSKIPAEISVAEKQIKILVSPD